MKKVFLILLLFAFGTSVMAQQKIQLRSTDRVECVKSDMTSLKAYFSYSSLDASNVETTRGEFSEIHIEGAYPNGNVGEPQLPMFTRLIAIPTGATPVVTVGAHSETQYTLSDYGIGTVSAMQAPVHKDIDPSTVEYAFSETAYARDSYNDDPIAMVEVLGTMRGITLGRLIVQPVRYNPVAGTVKVFNDIEVNVDFQNGDAESTAQMFRSTANVAFQSVYDQIFNIDMLMGGSRDAYTDHPDFYNTPVKMLVICYSGFQGNDALNSWLQWKLQKGYYVDIYYTGTGSNNAGTTATAIASFIKTKYNASVAAGNAYTYLVVIGDTGQVPQYMTKTVSYACASDLGYSSVNFSSNTSNYFPDMYYSRMSVENTTHLTNYINKVLTYEKYEFTDGGNYLNNVLLVGGWDESWTANVARPTINYGSNNYFNSSNTTYGGFSGGTIRAIVSTSSSEGYSGTNHGVYNGINDGACLVNYTAHGSRQEWQVPQFTAAQVATLTNTGKYFFGIGNCCLTGNFNNTTTSYSPGSAIGANACFAETMIRVPNAGAIAYVGCSPYSYWYEDFYWAVGAHSYSAGSAPTVSGSSQGVYDIMFNDQYWNSASSLMYLGNLAVQQAITNNNTNSSVTSGDCNNSAHYYFQFYHTFGDGSIMPYVTKPEANTVTIPNAVTPGTNSITVNAVAGSYVAVTDNSSVIYGVAEANSSGVATVNFTNAIPSNGTLYVVVTRQQYQPYFGTINIVGGTQYNITATQPQHGTISAPSQAYAGTTVTLTATPETGYCLSSWTVKQGSTNITVTNNQFTMPEGNVTVTATFVQGLAVTLASVSHGTISADPMYALQGTTINLTATPASGYEFDSWSVHKTGDANTTVSVNNNSFTMPNYPVTVSATFKSEPLTVANGTGTHSEIPFYGLYTDDNYQHTQTIYPASMLTNMQGCQITKLTYYLSSSVSKSFGSTFQVRLGTTTNSAFSNGTVNYISINDAAVYSGTLSVSGTTVEFDFSDNPYLYSSGNLVVDVRITALGSGYQSMSFYGESGSTYYSVKNRNTNSLPTTSGTSVSFMPKTTFTFTAATTEPYISLAPNSATILTGFTETLTTTYGNVSGTPSITYTSSNTNVATVSGNGTTVTVTAIAPGTATITATMTVDGTPYTATCTVTVENPSYCTPNPTSIDGKGITTLTFGTGDYVVNNSNSNGLPSSSPYYADYTSMVGGCEAGETVTVTITYSTGSNTVYSYGTIIWVDWNKNYTFEDSEIVYTGTSAQGSNGTPQVLTASFTIPSSQAAADYRMRIAGADSYFDSYIGGSSSANHDPCFTSTYAVCHDYTLRVVAASTDPVAITVSANPSNGGTVTGAGTYDPGTTATLTATANEGYTFTNWTRNGVAMSTNATYSFTVSTAATYVANFTLNNHTITATANPTEGGSVTVGSSKNRDDLFYDFEDGWQGWTTFQGNTTSPNSWMHNTAYPTSNNNFSSGYGYNSSDGFMLSESYISGSSNGGGTAVTPDNYLVSPQIRLGGSISFYAGARNTSYCAEKFSVMVSTTDNTNAASFTTVATWTLSLSQAGYNSTPYTVDLSAYSGMGYIAIRHYDCYDQWFLAVDNVTIVEGADQSTGSGNFNYGETCVVTATPNTDYYFVNWTENGNIVSTEPSYSFTVSGDRDLVANFSDAPIQTQTVTLTTGWNWFVPTAEISLADLEQALGSNGISISSQSQFARYDEDDDEWTGNLSALVPGQMYKIKVKSECNFNLSGNQPTSVTVTFVHGHNWFGYTGSSAASIENALGGFTPAEGDRISASNGKFANFEDGEWSGSLLQLQPGQGYIYIYNGSGSKSITF